MLALVGCPSGSGRQRGFEGAVDFEDGVGVGHFEDLEHFCARGDEAELAAADLHVAVEDQEGAEAGAVEVVDAGEVEDELVDAVICNLADRCSTSRSRVPRIMRPVNRKTAVVRSTGSYTASRIMGLVPSPVAARISQVVWQVLRFLICGRMGVGWALHGGVRNH
jgi:hypothetical protein